MLSKIVQFFSDWSYFTASVEVLAGIVAIAGAFIAVYNYFFPVLPGSTISRLFDTLKNGKSIATKAEVKYQIKCYIPPKFTCNGAAKTIRDLQKEIKKPSSVVFIAGKPASGKTTTMRNLYYRLSKSRKCVYVQMNSIRNINDFRERVKEQNTHRRSTEEKVTAFIEGVDESLAFELAENKTGVKAFSAMYLQGNNSEIYTIFKDCGLNLDSIVISLRPEFLEDPECLEGYKAANISRQVYTIQNLEKRDIIKIYKSLKVLRRLDKKEGVSRHQDGRYPPTLWEEWRYIRRFRKILDSTNDSIFQYPMYIRYAYQFMKMYWEQWNPYMENLTPASNMALSFRTLLDAIFKWEFHVYYEQKQGGVKKKSRQAEEERRFKAAMETCLERVLENMPMVPGEYTPTIPRECLEKILAECAYGEHDKLVIAHCVLSTDDWGQQFGFCHSTFYEYYLAQYMLKKADYETRKQHLRLSKRCENFRQMYYALLCQDQSLSLKLYNSIRNIGSRKLDLDSCLKLEKADILEIRDRTQMPVIDILSYLPFAPCFLYHEARFPQKQVEEMMAGEMDLSGTGWKNLEPTSGLAPCACVKNLDLHHLPLENVQGLSDFKNLSCLDIRINRNNMGIINEALKQLQGIPLEQLKILSGNGKVCIRIQEAMSLGEFQAEKIFVETPEFSEAHAEIYRLKCEAEELGKKNRFFILMRTSLARAKNEFQKSSKNVNLQVLKAVFELEADESGHLGLQKQTVGEESEEEATLWIGLTLAKYYKYLDRIDEDEKAYQVYNRLEPYIEKEFSKLSMHFGYEFGRRLDGLNNQRAKDWFAFVNKHISPGFSQIREIDVKIYLLKFCIRCGDTDLDDLKDAIEILLEKSPSFMETSDYYWYRRICCAQSLVKWEKGSPPPEKLLVLLQRYLDESKDYAEKNKNYSYQFTAIYLQLIYMNRIGDTDRAGALLADLGKIMPLVNENSDERTQQGRRIQYMQQTLYFLFVSGQRTHAIAAADALLEYPHRKKEISSKFVQYIRDCCAGEDELYVSADKHKLWGEIWC